MSEPSKAFAFAAAIDSTRQWIDRGPAAFVARAIPASQRFYVPFGVELTKDKAFGGIADLLHLPFELVSVLSETEMSHQGAVPTKSLSGEGIRIQTLTIAVDARSHWAQPFSSAVPKGEPWCYLFCLAREPASKVWMQTNPPVAVCKEIDDAGRLVMHQFAVEDDYALRLMKRGWSHKRLAEEAANDFHVVTELCVMLGVRNVTSKLVEPPPGAARMRRRKGRTPLYDYHVLVVDGEAWDAESGDGSGDGYRSHLRRGHIRRLEDGRRVWVRAAFVHGRVDGFVDKDYRVEVAS